LQTLLNHAHESGTSIFKTEWHSDIAETPEWGDKGSFYFIWPIQSDLVVPGVRIQKRQSFTTRSGIYDLINAGEREMILGADPIDVLEIDAHSERLIFLRDHDNVGEPLGVVHLTDKLGCQEPSNFFANGLPLLCSRSTEMLLHRFCFRVNSQTVLSQLPGYTWHVGWLPCKDVPVFMEELDERGILFAVECR
jgi:hypothetical protein